MASNSDFPMNPIAPEAARAFLDDINEEYRCYSGDGKKLDFLVSLAGVIRHYEGTIRHLRLQLRGYRKIRDIVEKVEHLEEP